MRDSAADPDRSPALEGLHGPWREATLEPGRGATRSEHTGCGWPRSSRRPRDVLLLRFEDPSGARTARRVAGRVTTWILVLPIDAHIRHYSLCGRLDERGSYTVRRSAGRRRAGVARSRSMTATSWSAPRCWFAGRAGNFPLVRRNRPTCCWQPAVSGIHAAVRDGSVAGPGRLPTAGRSCTARGRRMPWHFVRSSDSSAVTALRFVAQDTQGIAGLRLRDPRRRYPAGTAVYCCGAG